MELISKTLSLKQLKFEEFDAIFLIGGQSPLYIFVDNSELHKIFIKFNESGKIVAAVCHATCILLNVKQSNGNLLVEGKTWTGFADSEEAYAEQFVGQKIQPFWIESESKKIKSTNFIMGGMFKPFAVRDSNLITGQQQYSGKETAKLVTRALGA